MARKQRGRGTPATLVLRLTTLLVGLLAGFMIVSSALSARGSDLRPARNEDLAGLVADEAAHNRQLVEEVNRLRAEVDDLSGHAGDPELEAQVAEAAQLAGLTPVHGPAVQVTLTDAPLSVRPVGVDEDMLVVHQQDIQQVVNALWSGGAEAMTIQGQRVVSTTAVKCVGNSVVLHGVPYAPPYVITAIGDQQALSTALADSPGVRAYREYAQAYQLGYAEARVADATLAGYTGLLPGVSRVP